MELDIEKEEKREKIIQILDYTTEVRNILLIFQRGVATVTPPQGQQNRQTGVKTVKYIKCSKKTNIGNHTVLCGVVT